VKRKEVEALVVRTIQEKRRKYITGKIIIYGNNKEKVRQLAKQIGYKGYYSNAVDKEQVL
jgi:hypothetical protein